MAKNAKTKFYAAVRTHIASVQTRKDSGLAKRLRGAGGRSEVHKNGWAYIQTKPVGSCGAARKAEVALRKRLRKAKLKGSISLVAKQGSKERPLKKCPRGDFTSAKPRHRRRSPEEEARREAEVRQWFKEHAGYEDKPYATVVVDGKRVNLY